jgi:WD40 repeat protein
MMVSAVYAQPPPTLLWKDDTVGVTDIAVSKNGQYVVAATTGPDGSEVRFYDRVASTDPKTPLWVAGGGSVLEIYAVAISADGESVVAAFHLNLTPQEQAFSLQQQQGPPEYGVVYWKNAVTLAGNPDPTWVSVNLGGPVCGRCLDMSDDGNYVVVDLNTLGDGSVFGIDLWTGAKGLNTFPEGQKPTAWGAPGAVFTSVDMSDDGNYVAAGVLIQNNGLNGLVAYLKNTRTLTGLIENGNWISLVDGRVNDVAISDDGNYVAAATAGLPATVYYWAGAVSRVLNEAPGETPTWEGETGVSFTSIDMSCDGNSVIAGAGFLLRDAGAGGLATAGAAPTGGVYFWGGARGLTGTAPPSWTYPTVSTVSDVAINDAGTYMAAANDVAAHYAYFFDSSGALKWSEAYPLDSLVSSISISCDGGTLAVGTEGTLPVESGGTAYLFDTGFSTPCCGPEPVGGVLMPANTFTVFAPWLAVIGLVGCVGVVAVVAKRRRS